MATALVGDEENPAHRHGWSVELACPRCGVVAVPTMDGWTPSNAVNFGETPTIYANLACPACGADLKAEAGRTLVELFADVPTPPANRRLIATFLAVIVGLPLLLTAGVGLGVLAGWWGYQAFLALTLLPMLTLPTIFWFNRRIASLRATCPCGTPEYEFLGLLGRSSCYRCRSCGRKLRLRD